jgi:tRNA nucleotidyltransferase (CCA-adding enzyme)
MSAESSLHTLAPDLREVVLDVARRVRDAGGRALMVGGAVRDLLLHQPAKDIDLEVFGIPPDTLQALLSGRYALNLVGLSFGVLKLQGIDLDLSLPRRESKRGLGHKGFEIDSDPSLSIQEAASRRDFTINALYLDPLTG